MNAYLFVQEEEGSDQFRCQSLSWAQAQRLAMVVGVRCMTCDQLYEVADGSYLPRCCRDAMGCFVSQRLESHLRECLTDCGSGCDCLCHLYRERPEGERARPPEDECLDALRRARGLARAAMKRVVLLGGDLAWATEIIREDPWVGADPEVQTYLRERSF